MPRFPKPEREQALLEEQRKLFDGLGIVAGQLDILDIGCSDGRLYSDHLKSVARRYTGLEIELEPLARFKANTTPAPALVQGNAQALPFPDHAFDVVVLNDMLAYCDQSAAIAEALRVARPGGWVVSLHNNSLGWSTYKMRYPEKPAATEIAHSLVVMANTVLHQFTGAKVFRTVFNTRAGLSRAIRAAGGRPHRMWSTRAAYRWWHFVLAKPPPGQGASGTVAITGGYLSQNMGAAAMTIVTAGRLHRQGYSTELFSKYPRDDSPFADRYRIALRSTPQIASTFVVVPLLLLTTWLPPARRWIRRRWFPGIVLFYDLGGITFASSRGLSGFAINLTWLLIPLLLRIPLIKGSQAMGPFDRWYLRPVIPWLRRIDRIHARGRRTHAVLQEARIDAVLSPDIAFLLDLEPAPAPFPAPVNDTAGEFVTLIPSSVVMGRYDGLHGNGAYATLMLAVIAHLRARGLGVCLLAHSYRDGETPVSNDFPICRELHRRADSDAVVLYDVFGKTPGQLKQVIAASKAVVTGRFHGMVAALGSAVPVLVTSWSHKYQEVLDQFELTDSSIDWRDLDTDMLVARCEGLLVDAERMRAQLVEHLAVVKAGAESNFDDLDDIATRVD